MLTVRRMTVDDIDDACDLTARVFSKDDADRQDIFGMMRFAYHNCPFIPTDICWLGLVDGHMVVKWQLLDLQIRIAGAVVPVAGIQAVAAEPDANHKGYALATAIEALKEIRELDYDCVLGFAERGGLYKKLGTVPVSGEYDFELDARPIPPLRDDPFHEWSEDELPRVIDLYNESNLGRSGPIVRKVEHWPWLVRKPPVIHLAGEGYIGVRVNEDWLEIREVAGRGAAFHDAAVRKLADLAKAHGLRRIQGNVPADHPLVEAAIPYGARIAARYQKRNGFISLSMHPLRLLERARPELDARLAHSRHHDVELDLGVRSEAEESRLTLNAGGRTGRKIDLELHSSALQQLAFGYRSVRDLLLHHARERGAAPPALDDVSLDILETVFPKGHPFMWETDRF